MWPVLLFFLQNLLLCIIVTLSSLPGKFKYSFMNNFLSWGNYSQLRFNWTKEYYIYIYIYIYIYVCVYIYIQDMICKRIVCWLVWFWFGLVLVWFGLVLWHCRPFHAKYFSYIYIKYMISKHILYITFLNESELIFFSHSQKFSLISIYYE